MASTHKSSTSAIANNNVLNVDGCTMTYKSTTNKKTVILDQPESICMYSNKTIFNNFKNIDLHVGSCFNINILNIKETTETPKPVYKITQFLIIPKTSNVYGFTYYKYDGYYYSSNYSSFTYFMTLKNGILTTKINSDNTEVNVLITVCGCPSPETKTNNSKGGGSKRKHKKTRIHKPLNRKKKTYKSKQHNRLRR